MHNTFSKFSIAKEYFPNDKEKENKSDYPSKMNSQKKNGINNYQILNDNQSIGQGAFGTVQKARCLKTGNICAIKKLWKTQLIAYNEVSNIKSEVKLHKKLKFPHIIKLYDFFEDKEYVYLAMQYAENGSLYEHLRKKQALPENEAFIFFIQILSALNYMHNQNIIHRDIKPENILLDENYNIKLCDFGYSKNFSQDRTSYCGTKDYLSPEVLDGSNQTYKVDLWSLGNLLYEILFGYPPFRFTTPTRSQMVMQLKNFTDNIPFNSNTTVISQNAQNLIHNLLQFRPQDRLDMNEILEHPWIQENAYYLNLNGKKYVQIDQKPENLYQIHINSQQQQIYQQNPYSQQSPKTLTSSISDKFEFDQYYSNPSPQNNSPKIVKIQIQDMDSVNQSESSFEKKKEHYKKVSIQQQRQKQQDLKLKVKIEKQQSHVNSQFPQQQQQHQSSISKSPTSLCNQHQIEQEYFPSTPSTRNPQVKSEVFDANIHEKKQKDSTKSCKKPEKKSHNECTKFQSLATTPSNFSSQSLQQNFSQSFFKPSKDRIKKKENYDRKQIHSMKNVGSFSRNPSQDSKYSARTTVKAPQIMNTEIIYNKSSILNNYFPKEKTHTVIGNYSNIQFGSNTSNRKNTQSQQSLRGSSYDNFRK